MIERGKYFHNRKFWGLALNLGLVHELIAFLIQAMNACIFEYNELHYHEINETPYPKTP